LNFKYLFILLILLFSLGTAHALLTDDLVSYYKLDETSGTTAVDSFGSNDGTVNGATVNQTGKIGKQRFIIKQLLLQVGFI